MVPVQGGIQAESLLRALAWVVQRERRVPRVPDHEVLLLPEWLPINVKVSSYRKP